MTSANQVNELLYSKSPTWKAMIDGGMTAKIKLTLFSCTTGKGNGSIGWQIHQKYPNVTVVAPTDFWTVNYSRGFIFPSSFTLNYGYIKNGGVWKTY